MQSTKFEELWQRACDKSLTSNVSFAKVLDTYAEIIVRECIKEIGYKSAELLDIDFCPLYQERLKKYFGVE